MPKFYPTFSDVTKAPRCQMAYANKTGDQFSYEFGPLLRSRLRIVALIALIPQAYFTVIQSVLDSASSSHLHMIGTLLQGVVLLTVTVIGALLWSKIPLTSCQLRKLEIGIFGTATLFFGWLHYCSLYHAEFLNWVIPGSEAEFELFFLVMISLTLRWFFLIVLYGVFVPNTWQRSTTMIGLAVFITLSLTVVGAWNNDRLWPILFLPLLSVAVVLLAASAIAIFGSSRIHALHQEAYEAKQVGQYRLLEKIGAGGMGEVYRAEHMMLRRPCAVKLIRQDQAKDDITLSRFEREVKAMATLTHWNTVEIYDYGRTNEGTFYYVMEYLPGLSLEALVEKNGPIPAGRVIHFLRQICHALREAHNDGLLHRDIKPSNTITCERGGVYDVVKLLDFGLVHSLNLGKADKLTVQGSILGSPPFMSPEQARGRHDLTPASDIYGLGCVAYYLLTGKIPFERETVMEMLIAHASEKVTALQELDKQIPPDLESVILRCLEKKPENRYQSVDELEQALLNCQAVDDWTEEKARNWWHEHEKTPSKSSDKPISSVQDVTTSLESAAM